MINAFLRWFSRTKLWLWFCKKVMANTNLRFWGYTTFPINKYFEIVKRMQESEKEAPGIYAFACSDPKSFAGFVITEMLQAKTSHAGVFLPESIEDIENVRIFHMKSKGGVNWHFLELLKEIDYLAVVKYEFRSLTERDEAIRRLNQIMEDAPTYDFQQELESKDKIYCSELVYMIMKDLMFLGQGGTLRQVQSGVDFDRNTFEPDDVWMQATKIIYKNF